MQKTMDTIMEALPTIISNSSIKLELQNWPATVAVAIICVTVLAIHISDKVMPADHSGAHDERCAPE